MIGIYIYNFFAECYIPPGKLNNSGYKNAKHYFKAVSRNVGNALPRSRES